jgi:hypothetical protein
MRLDPSGFPPDMKERYEKIMQVRCFTCHSLERVIIALKTGVVPISGQPFDKITTEAYSIKDDAYAKFSHEERGNKSRHRTPELPTR